MFFPYCLGVSYLRNPFLGSSKKSSKLRSVHHHNMPYAIIFLLININKPSPLAVMLVLYTSGTICQSRSTIKKLRKEKQHTVLTCFDLMAKFIGYIVAFCSQIFRLCQLYIHGFIPVAPIMWCPSEISSTHLPFTPKIGVSEAATRHKLNLNHEINSKSIFCSSFYLMITPHCSAILFHIYGGFLSHGGTPSHPFRTMGVSMN